MSSIESQPDPPQVNNSHKSLQKQLLCAFVINLVSLLQGASVSTSSIILHSLQNSYSSNYSETSVNYSRSSNISKSISISNVTKIILFEDFGVMEESESSIGRKILCTIQQQTNTFPSQPAVGYLGI